MSFLSDDPNENTKSALNTLDKLMETEEGRVIAQQIKDKMKELAQTYEVLSEQDKKEFQSIFKNKFLESFEHLKENVEENVKSKIGDADFGEGFKKNVLRNVANDDWFQNYNVGILAILISIAIFG